MSNIQIGVSQLAKTGSKAQLEIIRQWLEHCDKNHSECCPAALSTSGFSIPTRLVDVGEPQCPSIKLVKTKPGDQMRYIALSHQWGKLKHFCTTMQNIEHHRDKINMHELPSTFRDAVNVTRGLGIRYIWIDSICIIQGADGDFHQEAPKMEGVFSSAYVVLAASSSDGQNDGFLKERGSRQCIRILHENMPDFYIGHFIDDFTKDVIDSPLNKRGWVLQERALARRTIYFTHTQTYWECGQGVHCETFRKMHNELSSFIGDPNFPMVALKSTRGARIRLFQNLYRQYSRLDFTRDYDRPLAIAGLEKRLIQAFNTSGGFGIFDDGRGLLRRSLLWYRSSIDTPLKLIQFPNDWKLKVPSWSWMAYQGGIEYLELPFQGVDWLLEEMTPPWCTSETTSTWRTGDEEEVPELHAVARSFDLGRMGRSTRGEAHAIYDRPVGGTKPNSSHNSVKCVVMGRLRDPAQIERNRRHYVLLVREGISGGQRQRRPVWERVGVGYLPGGWISLNDDGMDVVVR
ncbi:HET-domain-containing protein [Cryphonectria parasitica EP155]|uniref:HET-domain-containing protein n=1 Tax=Cryphonectria parasitica (strain ATCC 38755 / EP155) TaxID=660469 RepID=A0A9P5CLM8_CRYP1|nr:HET-domain-containing protein [Cryphonectria parasitica EP155]KAF3761990.1 HET-domain-containing protein [Cryphonectria parasitica EP155]